MGVETELWSRETRDAAGEGWLLTVAAPEEADPGEVPGELRALADDLRYRIALGVEPSNPDPEAWALLRQTMESIGRELGGVGHDPDSGHPRSFAE
jgi:hypothetical protein